MSSTSEKNEGKFGQSDILSYATLTELLSDYARRRRTENPSWSFGIWARQLGVDNVTTLSRTVAGTRSCSAALEEKLRRFFELDAIEEEYFHCLVVVQYVKDEKERVSFVAGKRAELRARQIHGDRVDELVRAELGSLVARIDKSAGTIEQALATKDDHTRSAARAVVEAELEKLTKAIRARLLSLGDKLISGVE